MPVPFSFTADVSLPQQVAATLEELLAALPAWERTHPPLSLFAGPVGNTLFYFYLAKMRDSPELYKQGYATLLRTFDEMEDNGIHQFSFCNGLLGFCLLFQLVVEQGLLEADAEETLSNFDELLVGYVDQQLAEHELDFLHGAIGSGLYLLARRGIPSVNQCLGRLIAYLDKTALEDEQGVRWVDAPSERNQYRADSINLSLSHGLASKIVFLSKCLRHQVEIPVVSKLLHGAVHFLQQQQAAGRAANRFPSTVTVDGRQSFTSRLAWCYGDLGVVVALLHAGQAAQQPQWMEQAVGLAAATTCRTHETETQLVDGEFCHGTAGVAHIYNRLFHQTGQPCFREARERWIQATLQHRSFVDGIAGFKTSRPDGWHNDASLLEGAMGIGLVLQSYLETDTVNFTWDSILLLDWAH